jgi:hypothetical protein
MNYYNKYLKYKLKYEIYKKDNELNLQFYNQFKNFQFKIERCNELYFNNLLELLNLFHPTDENFENFNHLTINQIKKAIDNNEIKENIKLCTYIGFKSCEPDIYFFENKLQVVLGKYNDNVGCYYQCTKYFFTLSIDPYTLFKNDLLIRWILEYPNLIAGNEIEIENIFPIRILISDKVIPNLSLNTSDSKLTVLEKYAPEKFTNPINREKLLNSYVTSIITEDKPGNITSREICLLYMQKFYFYIVLRDDNVFEPFILVSKYEINEILAKFIMAKKKIPNLQLLF